MTDTLENVLGRLIRLERRVSHVERVEVPSAPSIAMGRALNGLQMMPGLVGLWPGSVLAGNLDKVADLSGNGLHLTRQSGMQIASLTELLPFMAFNGSTGYVSHPDNPLLDIAGTEGIVTSAIRGLTMGGWFYFDNDAGNNPEVLMGKMSAFSHQASAYFIQRNTSAFAGRLIFRIGDGSTFYTAQGDTMSAGAWHFIVGRFTPSTEVKLWIDDVAVTETNSIPATLQNTSDSFAIGARTAAGDNFFDGRAALCFLCAAAVPDVLIEAFYRNSRSLFDG